MMCAQLHCKPSHCYKPQNIQSKCHPTPLDLRLHPSTTAPGCCRPSTLSGLETDEGGREKEGTNPWRWNGPKEGSRVWVGSADMGLNDHLAMLLGCGARAHEAVATSHCLADNTSDECLCNRLGRIVASDEHDAVLDTSNTICGYSCNYSRFTVTAASEGDPTLLRHQSLSMHLEVHGDTLECASELYW
jgi:hypothetical protein